MLIFDLFFYNHSGEHAFSYILDGDKILADPTIPVKEEDDFGTINSILVVEAS